MRRPEYSKQHGEREPCCAASCEPTGIQEDRVEEQREDRDADECQQPSGCDRVAFAAAQEAPQECDGLDVRRGVLCRHLLREEWALLLERSLGHARDERDERRRVGRHPQRVVADSRPDGQDEKAGEEREDRAAECEIEVETREEWASEGRDVAADRRCNQGDANATQLPSSLLDLVGEPLCALLRAP